MTLDKDGNYLPWVQPKYGTDAQDNPVTPPKGYAIVPEGAEIKHRWRVFDVYAGWMTPDDYCARNRHHTRSDGRWTTWARPMRSNAKLTDPLKGNNEHT